MVGGKANGKSIRSIWHASVNAPKIGGEIPRLGDSVSMSVLQAFQLIAYEHTNGTVTISGHGEREGLTIEFPSRSLAYRFILGLGTMSADYSLPEAAPDVPRKTWHSSLRKTKFRSLRF
jgi:hypothetical protein